jgi:16S rRNA processing protein RimM
MDVVVGVAGKPHGLKGELFVRPRTDEVSGRFAVGAVVRADERALRVAGVRDQAGALVVRFVEIADRSQAEALRGATLWADSDERDSEPDADEFHDVHLIGLRVFDESGRDRGEVVRVEHLPAQDALVVAGEAGERLVPFVRELVPEVDLADGWLTVNAIPGLLEDADAD